MENSYDAPMLAAAQAVASDNNATLKVFDANNSPQTQYSQLQDVITSGQYSGIILQPIFGTGLISLVQQAIAKGIKVVNMDQVLGPNYSTDAPQVAGLAANVMFVPTEIGTKLGNMVVQACQSKNLNPCNVGYLYDIKASALDVAISGAFNKAIAAAPGVKVVAQGQSFFSPTEGLTAVQNMLAANASLNLIVGSDQGIEGGVQAVAAKHLTGKVILVGYGASAAALAGVASGAWYGDVAQAPASEGRLAVQALVKALRTGQGQRRHRPGGPAARQRHRDQGQRVPVHRRVAGLTVPAPQHRDPHVELVDIGKSFGGVRALDGISLTIEKGSIHALVGENGAGKSTLGKILAGVIAPDRGQLLIGGEPVAFRSPREAIVRGIVLIAQELSIAPALSVAENVFLGTEPRRAGFVARRALRRRYDELAAAAGFELGGDLPGRALRTADQQKVEILRALCRDARLIVMDEPTAALPRPDADRLYQVIRRLAAGGTTIVLVSHFLREVAELADEVTILRDGRLVRTAPAADETEETMLSSMLGRSLGTAFPARRPVPAQAPIVLQARGLSAPGVHDVSLDVRAGEIVGLAGLVGSGRTELARALCRAQRVTAGTVSVAGAPLTGQGPSAALRAGLAMIPESRKEQGLMLGRPIAENVSLASLTRLSDLGLVRRRAERQAVATVLGQVGVRVPAQGAPVSTLSGGNQQKAPVRAHLAARSAGPGRRRADQGRGRRRQARHLRTADLARGRRPRCAAHLLRRRGDPRACAPGAGDAGRPDRRRTPR